MSKMFAEDRLIFLVYFGLIILPYFMPIALPLAISKETQAFYNTLEAVPEGGAVLWSTDGNFQMWPDFGGGEIAIYKELFRMARTKSVRLVFVHFQMDGAVLADRTISDIVGRGMAEGLVYGVDYVNFGYLPGGEPSMRKVADDIWGICKTDWYGTPIEQIPMMKDFHSIRDFSLAGWGHAYVEEHGRQWAGYGVPLLVNMTAINISLTIPWFVQGLINGFLPGQRGGAEFEILTGFLGQSSAAMSGQVFAHTLAIILLILPNIYFLLRKAGGGTK